MTSFSIFSQVLPGGTGIGGDAGSPIDLGVQFQITASGYLLDGYWFYVPSGGTTTGASYSFRLYSTPDGTTGTPVSGSTVTGSGTWTAAAWNFTALSPTVSLASGTTYVGTVTAPASATQYQSLLNFWTSGGGAGGITNGPVTAPSDAASLGTRQQVFNDPSTGGMPTTVFNASFYGVDIDVSAPAAPPSGPAYTAFMSSM